MFLSPHPPLAGIVRRKEWQPGYAKLEKEGKLTPRIKQARSIFERWELCPRKGGMNQMKGILASHRSPLLLEGKLESWVHGGKK